MKSRLLVGLSARIYTPMSPVLELGGVFTRTLHYLEQSVAHWVMSPDVLAVMIPAVESQGLVQRSDLSLRAYAEALDALVLQGGNDVAPQTYRESPLAPSWHGDRVRDIYEIGLFEAFVALGKPVLGICRGCQLINVALGGTLYQDIPTQLPHAQPHHDIGQYERQLHDVSLVQGGRLAALYPELGRAAVNSIHHQAIKDLGRDLAIEAIAVPDGLVEAVRWRGPSYVFGVQWHPEFMAHKTLRDDQLDCTPILQEFLSAARERKAAERG